MMWIKRVIGIIVFVAAITGTLTCGRILNKTTDATPTGEYAFFVAVCTLCVVIAITMIVLLMAGVFDIKKR